MYKMFWFSMLMAGLQIAQAQPSTFDPNFGTSGFVTTTVLGGNEFGVYTAIQTDGKVIQAGNAGTQSVILRYNTNGTLDNTFGTNGIVTKTYGSYSSSINKVTISIDGKIFVSGYYYTNTGLTTYASFVAKYNTDGTPDNTFGTAGISYITISGNPNFSCGGTLTILSTGGILLGGSATISSPDILIVKLLPNGSIDNSFGNNGVVIRDLTFKDVIQDLIELPNGQIFAVAYVKINSDYYDTGLFKYNANGTPDNSFGTNGYKTNSLSPSNLDNFPTSIKLTPTGKLVVGGYIYNGSNYDLILSRYFLNGSLDNTFNGNGKVVVDLGGNDVISAIKVLKNGEILAVGPTQTTSSYNTTLAKFDTTGQLKTSYGTNGKVTIPSGLTLSGASNMGTLPSVLSGLDITPNESVIYIATSYKIGSSYPFFLAKLGTGTGVTIPTSTSTGSTTCDLPSKFGFYTINQSTKDLYFVDTLGTFTKIGNTNLKTIGKYRGMDFDANNNLYLLGDLDSLYKISASSGKATFVSKLNQPGLTDPRGPAISFAPNGQLYILDELAAFPEGTLRKVVNLATGLTTTVGTSTTGFPSVLAIDFDNLGTLWATDECCDLKLHKLNTVSGISTFSASQTLNNSFPSELDHSNGKLYGISIENETSSNATTFYSINKNTGAATTLFTTTGIYVGLAGRNKPIYTDTTYLTQVVTVTAFQTITVIAFQTVTVTNFQTLTVTSIVTVHDCGTVTGGNLGGRVDAASISVYPNPSSSKISITSNGQIVFSADVLDSRGISIFLTYYPNSIDVAEWPKGVYLLRAKDEEGNVLKTFKIVKE